MARELPIHNGRLTTDLDADGHRIKNLPGGTETVSWDNVTGKPTFATVATSGSYNDLTDKPTIPAPVTVDPSLSPTSENPVQNKVVSKALYTGFTEWKCDSIASGYTFVSCVWDDYMGDTGWICTVLDDDDSTLMFYLGSNQEATSLSFDSPSIVITRHLITPTKTSQLTNDGAPNGGGTPYATTAQIPDVTGKADKAVPSAAGNLASLNAQGNLVDSGVKPSDFAAKADLPYALVTPGEWEFSGEPEGWIVEKSSMEYSDGNWTVSVTDGSEDPTRYDFEGSGSENATAVLLSVTHGEDIITITATRTSLPGHLLDRAGNLVVVSGDTTLTLPDAVPGYIRDFLVRLEISGSTVPTITFAAPTGETLTYETDGDEFPVPDAEGTWLYSFTETAAGVFAVALKKVNAVAQGGS